MANERTNERDPSQSGYKIALVLLVLFLVLLIVHFEAQLLIEHFLAVFCVVYIAAELNRLGSRDRKRFPKELFRVCLLPESLQFSALPLKSFLQLLVLAQELVVLLLELLVLLVLHLG